MLGRGEPNEANIVQFKEELVAKLNVYDKILSKQPYLAGQVRRELRRQRPQLFCIDI